MAACGGGCVRRPSNIPRAQRERWLRRTLSCSGTTVKPSATGSYWTSPRVRQHRPGEHDVLADRIRPAADGTEVTRPVGRERALGDERGVVGRLHALDAVDPESVVPLLHPGDERRQRILGDERGCAGADVLALRRARQRERRVASATADAEGCRHRPSPRAVSSPSRGQRSGRGACPVLPRRRVGSGTGGEHPPRPPAARCRRSSCCRRRRLRDDRGMRGRRCVRACGRSPALSFHAATTIVTGGHSPSGQSPLGGSSGSSSVARDQEREDHEPDDQAGDVGEEDRDHPGHDGADRILELASPDRATPRR